MKELFKIGDKKYHEKIVLDSDLVSFQSGIVHPVCSTFALAREIEWTSRLFVLEMLEEDEEGIGTKLEIDHISPALSREKMQFEAVIFSLIDHEIVCDIKVMVGDRLIADCITGQKILKRTKIKQLISDIQKND